MSLLAQFLKYFFEPFSFGAIYFIQNSNLLKQGPNMDIIHM